MPRSVFAIISCHGLLCEVVEALCKAGFRTRDISVLIPDQHASHPGSDDPGAWCPDDALTGSDRYGLAGLEGGISTLAIPGFAPLITVGPLLASLNGVGHAIGEGGLAGGLVGLRVPPYEARLYDNLVRAGGILISVQGDDAPWIDLVRVTLSALGATHIALSFEESSSLLPGRGIREATRRTAARCRTTELLVAEDAVR